MILVSFWATTKYYKNPEKDLAFLSYYVVYVHKYRTVWHFKTGPICCP